MLFWYKHTANGNPADVTTRETCRQRGKVDGLLQSVVLEAYVLPCKYIGTLQYSTVLYSRALVPLSCMAVEMFGEMLSTLIRHVVMRMPSVLFSSPE